jgi:hypothetical protein
MPVAIRVYKALLHLYPWSFRQEFAPDMARDFEDASRDAWQGAGWAGLALLWLTVAADLAQSLVVQWIRSGALIAGMLAGAAAFTSVSAAVTFVPKAPFAVQLPPDDRDLAVLMLLTACVLLIIAATIIFSLWFLRPLLHRKAPELKLGPTSSLLRRK